MHKMKRSVEAEVSVQLDFTTQKANVTVAEWPAMLRKLTRLYGEPGKVAHSRGGNSITTAFWSLPLKAISFRKVKNESNSANLALLAALA